MARPETIIVGGGIAATNPFTIGALPYIVNNSPASISATSIAGFTTGTGGTHPAIIISAGIVDPQPAAAAVLRVAGGIISEAVGASDSLVLGRGATAGATNMAIGTLAVAAATSGMAIGHNSSANGNNSTAIGAGASANGGGGAGSALAVGRAATANNVQATALGANSIASAIASLAVGQGATADATGAIAVGSAANANGFAAITIGFNAPPRQADQVLIIAGGNSPTIGAGATGGLVLVSGGTVSITHANQIAIGQGATSFVANCAIIGASGLPISTVVIGRGNTHTASVGGLTLRCTNGITTNNLVMGNLTVIAPLATGNATVGAINFQTGVAQASGNTSQAARTGLAVQSSATAADTDMLVFDVDSATLKRVSVGANDSGGAGFKLLRIVN